MNDEEKIKEIGLNVRDVWSDFVFFNIGMIGLQRCASITIPKVDNEEVSDIFCKE